MPDETTQASGQEPTTGTGQAPTTTPAPDPVSGTTMTLEQALEALAATRREAAAHRTKATTLEKEKADAETARLSDLEKAQAKAAALEVALAARDHADLQRAVAKEHNLPDDLALRLQGKTRDELAEDAKALAKLLPPAAPSQAGATNPARGHAQGQMTMADVKKLTRQQVAAMNPAEKAQMYQAMARG